MSFPSSVIVVDCVAQFIRNDRLSLSLPLSLPHWLVLFWAYLLIVVNILGECILRGSIECDWIYCARLVVTSSVTRTRHNADKGTICLGGGGGGEGEGGGNHHTKGKIIIKSSKCLWIFVCVWSMVFGGNVPGRWAHHQAGGGNLDRWPNSRHYCLSFLLISYAILRANLSFPCSLCYHHHHLANPLGLSECIGSIYIL